MKLRGLHLRSANTRFAHQAITISPNREYILEYSYAIKNGVADEEDELDKTSANKR